MSQQLIHGSKEWTIKHLPQLGEDCYIQYSQGSPLGLLIMPSGGVAVGGKIDLVVLIDEEENLPIKKYLEYKGQAISAAERAIAPSPYVVRRIMEYQLCKYEPRMLRMATPAYIKFIGLKSISGTINGEGYDEESETL